MKYATKYGNGSKYIYDILLTSILSSFYNIFNIGVVIFGLLIF